MLLITICSYLAHHQNITISHLQTTQRHQQEQLKQIQQVKSQRLNQQKQLNKLTVQKNILDTNTQSNQALLTLLQTLPAMTPPKSWLNSVELLENHIEITANSYYFQDISKLPNRLENSHLFNKIELKKLARIKNLNHLHLSATHQRETYE